MENEFKRGMLTPEITIKALEVLDTEITQVELRLMAYVQYLLTNSENIDPNKVNSDDRVALNLWRHRGWIEGGASDLAVTKEFWDAMGEILWLGYVEGKLD